MTEVYDNKDFFAEYSAMDRSVKGLDGAPEWPQYRALLPKLDGLNVLYLGCGMGWFSRWVVGQGAKSSQGLGNSHNMLALAEEKTNHGDISYEFANLDQVSFGEDMKNKFDLAHSSLVLHYLVNLEELVKQVHQVLVPGGNFVFSVEHPIFTSTYHQDCIVDDKTGNTYWSLSYYPDEGTRQIHWLSGNMEKQHRATAAYINVLLNNGFEIKGFDEWCTPQDILASFGRYGVRESPMFLMISAVKK
ncbi:S-adenosyl-L-methionine-dependent methyltransferase [Fusarium redolens]|uniref:S-adenosyl-L-methionine-dependent methyltransferase n=1 Tax=Fusarium redolens TaxID=48865 RepID=A0A9P9JQS4_FUSRE|nr:S-adenosyl-L-methionine-dependent methyltransferase [Fusarium redolens]KAH7216943.1 S-adenosyl-L-methionine-dependent methyltransferase [Fusarium redolens]